MKNSLLIAIALFIISIPALALGHEPADQDIYQIKIYRIKTIEQVNQVDNYLKSAYLPALHRLGIAKVGVFKNVGIDTSVEKSIYVLIPMRSLEQLNQIEDGLAKDAVYNKDGAVYLNTAYNAPAYARMETIVLRAFKDMSHYQVPQLKGDTVQRIYELRSYEGATEKLYKQKVRMFNEGGEIVLFNKLGFNAVFYGEVLAGSHMPNLMYMTSFDNTASRDEHWKTFGADPEWKRISALPEYQNTVSKLEIFLLNPTGYSEL